MCGAEHANDDQQFMQEAFDNYCKRMDAVKLLIIRLNEMVSER